MSGNSAFVLKENRNWSRGLSNMLRIELARWWKTRTWWVQCLIWIAAVDSVVFLVLLASRTEGDPAGFPELLMLYSIFGGLAVAIGVTIVTQGAIVGEKSSGTAAWVLSKPVSRTAFMLSKLLGNGLGMTVTAVIVPGLVVYAGLSLLTDDDVALLPFFGGMGILVIAMLFWMALALMLGTFFNSRGPVIGIPMALILGFQFILAVAPWMAYVIPYGLAFPLGEEEIPSVAAAVIIGQAPESWIPVYSAVVMIFIFTLVGIFRFSREEL